MINFQIKDYKAQVRSIEIPDYINLSLMEVLKAWEYPVAATCGGIAQCATCHVIVNEGLERLSEAGEVELDRLDLLNECNYKSRLACQINVKEIDGCFFELKGNGSVCSPKISMSA